MTNNAVSMENCCQFSFRDQCLFFQRIFSITLQKIVRSKDKIPKNIMSLDKIYAAKSAAEEELSALNTEISELMEQVKAKRAAVQAVKRKLTSLGKKRPKLRPWQPRKSATQKPRSWPLRSSTATRAWKR